MAQIRLSPRAQRDLERLYDFLAARNPKAAEESFRRILDGVDVLARHPLVGRTVQGELRELVISHGKTGYVALYRFFEERNIVRVVAIRHQREAGHSD